MYIQTIILFCFIFVVATFGKNIRIIEGFYAKSSDFAFHASLRRISDNRNICGGAIITNLHIVTAAHCVMEPYVSHVNLKIVLGTSNITENAGNTYIPDRIFIHPKFTGVLEEVSIFHNDIAVIRVDREIEFSSSQSPIYLPQKNIANGDIGILSGWGSTTYPSISMPDTLRKNWMRIIDFKHCMPLLPFKMRQDQFCAFQKRGVGSCVGDNGGPLVNLNTLVGIVSIVRPCATGVPDVFTNIHSHLEFIKIAAALIN